MRVGILTGGGDCPGLNPAIRGATLRLIREGYEPVGIQRGWRGVLDQLTTPLNADIVDEIIQQGGTVLGTSRTNPFRKEEDTKRLFESLEALHLDALIAIGGEDTLGVAYKLHQHGVQVVGVPKTMDNDLSGTDYTFGFDTAVGVAVEAMDRLRDTARSHARVIVLEVMGRNAGWVALYSGLAGGADWIVIPEVENDMDEMCDYICALRSHGKVYALIVVAEGIEMPYEPPQENLQMDAFGHIILRERGIGAWLAKEVENRTGFETRYAVIGHVQRGGPPTMFDRVLATRLGSKAAELVTQRQFGKLASLRGTEIVAVPLQDALAESKRVPVELYEEIKQIFKRSY